MANFRHVRFNLDVPSDRFPTLDAHTPGASRTRPHGIDLVALNGFGPCSRRDTTSGVIGCRPDKINAAPPRTPRSSYASS